MVTEITSGDIIGYAITLIVGILTGVGGDRLFIKIKSSSKTKIVQSKNKVRNGDIVAGNKYGK